MRKQENSCLRPLEEKDAERMLQCMSNPEVSKWFQASFAEKTLKDILFFISSTKYEIRDGVSIHYAITNEDNLYIGTVSLKNIDLSNRNAEYAIMVMPDFQGCGVATRATFEILRIAFDEIGLQKVYLNVIENNERAISLYTKCGFVYEGKARNHIVKNEQAISLNWYSILCSEFNEETSWE